MSKIVDVAAIAFQVSERNDQGKEEAFRQFHEAEERLDGTGIDLVVTCEGMLMVQKNIEDAESIENPGPLLRLYRDFSIRNCCITVGSVKLKENGKVFNTQVFIDGNGKFFGRYRKAFPTPREIECGIMPGPGAEAIESELGKLGGAICYDLNFDELFLQYREKHIQLLCFSSMFHGGPLINDRAYMARSFLAGSIKDGGSIVIDPLGRTVAESCYYNRIARARINTDFFIMHQDNNAGKFTEIRRKYGKKVLIDTSSLLGVSLLYSCTEEFSAADVASEFGLQALDDLLQESREKAAAAR